MSYRYSIIVVFLLIVGGLVSVVAAGQDETCNMDDKEHKAHYHCPNSFEVVYTGEGSKECDGSCYKKGDQRSLQQAIAELLKRQKLSQMVSSEVIRSASDDLLSTGKAIITTPQRTIMLRAPRH